MVISFVPHESLQKDYFVMLGCTRDNFSSLCHSALKMGGNSAIRNCWIGENWKRGNKIAPLWHKCRAKWDTSTEGVQCYCPLKHLSSNCIIITLFHCSTFKPPLSKLFQKTNTMQLYFPQIAMYIFRIIEHCLYLSVGLVGSLIFCCFCLLLN